MKERSVPEAPVVVVTAARKGIGAAFAPDARFPVSSALRAVTNRNRRVDGGLARPA